jgi:hypothetical protein
MLYPQFGRPLGQRRHYVAGHGEAVILLWRSQPAAYSTIPPSRGWPAWFVPPPCHKLPGEKIAEPGDMTARSTGTSGAAVPRAIDAGVVRQDCLPSQWSRAGRTSVPANLTKARRRWVPCRAAGPVPGGCGTILDVGNVHQKSHAGG